MVDTTIRLLLARSLRPALLVPAVWVLETEPRARLQRLHLGPIPLVAWAELAQATQALHLPVLAQASAPEAPEPQEAQVAQEAQEAQETQGQESQAQEQEAQA